MNVSAPVVNSTNSTVPVEAPKLTPAQIAQSASNFSLGFHLFFNFETFIDPKTGYITPESLRKVAISGLHSPKDRAVAEETRKRHDFMYALDKDGKGLLDSRIYREDIFNAIAPSNDEKNFGGWSDKAMSKYLVMNFKKFTDPNDPNFVTRSSLERAAHSKGEDGFTAEDSSFARELLRRLDLFKRMDAAPNGSLDDKIGINTLKEIVGYSSVETYGSGYPQKIDYDERGQEIAGYYKGHYATECTRL
ncbi:hypothetical protein [Pseudomonas sp. R76]|uniref:hypothetical protein n=1 Tax=Pseudomonas sp. R76 TaxID=1573711 RepID=UPI0013200861|nr:hypothetical protein [Pseudomonas sp. R76]QHD08402.1 hypothetical protein PspR76_22985 [Pseudomonas sp. R76]